MSSSDPLLQYLFQGDLLGFVVACFTRVLGQLFYGVIILLFSVPLYIKTQSFSYICILWILLGGILQAMVPIEGFQLGWLLVVIGIGGLLYRAVRG